MHALLDSDRYPLHDIDSNPGRELIETCRSSLDQTGMFNLEGFVRQQALRKCVGELMPIFRSNAFAHKRSHNIYFDDNIVGSHQNHGALRRFETINQTVCADQIPNSIICNIYEWQPFIDFLAKVVGKKRLYQMADPLARANVMAYQHGEALNWHFDRSEFTTTLLLQSPEHGGEFQYRSGLRADDDPNYHGVAQLLEGSDTEVQTLALAAGTLNVFKGRYTAHRVTPVQGSRDRMVAVFSYYEQPGVMFSESERVGFYGRANALR